MNAEQELKDNGYQLLRGCLSLGSTAGGGRTYAEYRTTFGGPLGLIKSKATASKELVEDEGFDLPAGLRENCAEAVLSLVLGSTGHTND